MSLEPIARECFSKSYWLLHGPPPQSISELSLVALSCHISHRRHQSVIMGFPESSGMDQRASYIFAPAVLYLREENRRLGSKSSKVAMIRLALMTQDG